MTLRLDVNDYWVLKLEGHAINGTASTILSGVGDYNYGSLQTEPTVDLKRDWALFLAKSTVAF